MTDGLTTFWHDSLLRWQVSSEDRPEIIHQVDLAAFGGVGRCSCEHFEFRILPKIDTEPRRCKHLLAARNAFADTLIQSLRKNDEQHERSGE